MESNDFCNETIAISTNAWFWGSKCCKLILSPVAFCLNVLLIVVLRRCTLLHINVRYLLINLSLCSAVASLYIFGKSMYTVFGVFLGTPCLLQVSHLACKLQEAVFVFFKLPVTCSMLGIGIERKYASANFESYDTEENPKLSKLILCATFLFSLVASTILLATVTDGSVPYCNVLLVYNDVALKILCVGFFIMETCTLLIYIYTWYVSTKRMKPAAINQVQYKLAIRYQLLESLSVTATMTPSVILHAICWLTIYSFAIGQSLVINLSLEQKIILSQYLFYGLTLVHMTLHPLLCFYRCRIIRAELFKMIPSSIRFLSRKQEVPFVIVHTCVNEEEKHFEILADMWNSG